MPITRVSFQRRLREGYFLTRWLGRLQPEGRLLEVGCALGFLLAGLQRSGWRVEGVDASAFAAYYARTRYNIDVTCATLEETAFPDGAFDVVIQKDLLEHVADPRRHLDETHRLLRPGGWLRLVTPNGEANLRPLVAASDAPGATPPVLDQGHLSFFSRWHLVRLFDECGFRCRRMRTIGIRRGLTALGRLPGQAKFVRRAAPATAPARPAVVAGAGGDAEERFRRLAARIDRDIAIRHSGLRSWTPYYHYHRVNEAAGRATRLVRSGVRLRLSVAEGVAREALQSARRHEQLTCAPKPPDRRRLGEGGQRRVDRWRVGMPE